MELITLNSTFPLRQGNLHGAGVQSELFSQLFEISFAMRNFSSKRAEVYPNEAQKKLRAGEGAYKAVQKHT